MVAIYVMFKCCRCESWETWKLCSYTRNENGTIYLCEHFKIYYSFKAHYAFFSLGWSIDMYIRADCRKCSSCRTLCDKKFSSNHTSDNDYFECHSNVLAFGVRGNEHDCSYQGTRRQEEIFSKERK